jgi:hypothetical protein
MPRAAIVVCLLRFDALPLSQNSPCVGLPFTSMFRDAIESREMSVRGPLTGHLTGRVLRGMFA